MDDAYLKELYAPVPNLPTLNDLNIRHGSEPIGENPLLRDKRLSLLETHHLYNNSMKQILESKAEVQHKMLNNHLQMLSNTFKGELNQIKSNMAYQDQVFKNQFD